MPAITVSAVNTGTDTLTTGTAHGLTTGDRCRVRNVGGALPTGLTAAVDVFAVRVDATNLKLADTNAHALAGTGIFDLTGSGSGTTTVEYGLPYTIPNAIAVPLGQLKSADLNGTWAALVALYALLTGQAQSIWAGVVLAANQHVALSGTGKFKHGTRTLTIGPAGMAPIGANGAYNLASLSASTSTSVQCHIRLPVGARILAVRAYLQDSGVGPTPVQLAVFSTNTTGSVSATLGTSSNSSGAGTNQTLSVTGLTSTIAAANSYVAIVQRASGTAAFSVFLFEVDYDEP